MNAVLDPVRQQAGDHTAAPPGGGYLCCRHDAVAGRVRFRVAALYRNEDLKSVVTIRLAALPGVRAVRINVLTGSLLIHYDPARPLPELTAAIERALGGLPLAHAARRPEPGDLFQQLFRSTGKPLASRSPRVSNRGSGSGPVPRQPSPAGKLWHALSIEALFAELNSAAGGLTSAAAAERLARFGANVLPQPERRSDLNMLLEQFASPPVALLGISAAIAIATGGVLDAAVILSVVLINALIGFVTERQSERIIAALGPVRSKTVSVLRDGDYRSLPAEELTPGDVFLLRPGSDVAADGRLLAAERLSLDESALTGESLPVEKHARTLEQEDVPLGDRRNMVYRGTLVTGGSGAAMVVGAGLDTEIGRIQSLAESARPPVTVVERQLDELGGQLAWMSAAICGLVFVAGLLRGHGWLEMLKSSISLAVAAVPEGLPTVATTTLAIGIRHMRERKVLVRRLDAVETLGSVQVFCLDKTGTLTQNRMAVAALYAGKRRIAVSGEGFRCAGRALEPLAIPELRLLFTIVALCNETEVSGGQLNGTATEKALLELAMMAGVDVAHLRRTCPQLSIQHRAEDQPYMATVHAAPTGQRLTAVKGSPEQVLALCRWAMQDGRLRELDAGERKAILRENERMAGDALRVLGVAYAIPEDAAAPLNELVWLGLTGMADPLRPGMAALLERFHRAGIATLIITGDQSATAYAIARQLDLADGRPVEILDSIRLDKVDPEVLSGVVRQVQVFSRVSPAHKLQIVRALQQGGRIVAMTGDGINDGPALKAANLGVAMGGGGAEVARSVADIVLEDDNLNTMIVAIRDGRTIYNNIRKSIRYLLSTNLSEIELMLASIGLGLGQPLNPMQLLWINLATDIFPSLALAMEEPEPDILEQPPRDPAEPIISGRDLRRLALESAVITGGALASYGYGLLRYGAGPTANTHAFMTLTLAQLLHALSSRSEQHSLLDRDRPLPRNRHLNRALGVSLAAQGLTQWLPLRRLLGAAPLGLGDLLVVGAGAALPLLINEATKKTAAARPGSPAGIPASAGAPAV